MAEKYVHGIDLGTTYSCIAYVDQNAQANTCKDTKTNLSTVPSVVRYKEDGTTIVGASAKQQSIVYPDDTISFVKRKIGQEDIVRYGANMDKEVSPIDVSAEILKKMAEIASIMEEGADIKTVVITVPAYFGHTEKTATIEAGKRAGFETINIIEEPTAAAVYYGLKDERQETVLVYDLGGGTFDITAIKIDNSTFRVLTTEGERLLGGADWDKRMADIIKEKFQDESGHNDEYDSFAEQEIMNVAEERKKYLTDDDEVDVSLALDGRRAMFTVTRDEFEDATEDLLSQTMVLTQEVYDRVTSQGETINKILLVGGSTKMPQVEKAIRSTFPNMEVIINEPDEAVAKGAALFAFYKLFSDVDDESGPGLTGLVDVPGEGEGGTPKPQFAIPGGYKDVNGGIAVPPGGINPICVANKSLGIRVIHPDTQELVIYNMIKKDTELPHSLSEDNFILPRDNMSSFELALFQFNSYDEYIPDDENLMIGSCMVPLRTPNSRGDHVHIVLSISEDGIIHAEGCDPRYPEDMKELTIENAVAIESR